jgi:choline monooxygenase
VSESVVDLISAYEADNPLAEASTIPSSWYTDPRIFELEKQTVFSNSWQVAARIDQLTKPGDYVTTDIGDEPIVVVRGNDDQVRGFFNVCRHHAAAVMTEREGHANQMRCPYHGWTYSLEGELKGTPDFNDVCSFDRAKNGLMPIEIDVWEKWIFARVGDGEGRNSNKKKLSLPDFVGVDLVEQFQKLELATLNWFERRSYKLNCNWKVFVDNYLDGG